MIELDKFNKEENKENQENKGENNFFDDKEYEYWLICPYCKNKIPIIHLFISTGEQVIENNVVKEIKDILYVDINCKTCKFFTIPLEIYLDFIKKNGKMIKPEIIDLKFKNNKFNVDKNIIYCMDQHGFIDYKHYMMHNVIKFKIPHVICEKELDIDSYCNLNQNHDYYKKAKYFCQFCNLALCKSCKNYHEINKKNHPISGLENETILIEDIFNNFNQIIKNLNEKNQKLKINELIMQYVFLLKNNYDRISKKHIPNYCLIQNFKLLHKIENDYKYLIDSKAYSLNFYFENIIPLNNKIDLHILKLDEVNNEYTFLLYSNKNIYLCKYHNNVFNKNEIKRPEGESNNGILKKINNNEYYIFINSNKKNDYSLLSIDINGNKYIKYSISKSDYCSSYFNISSFDNMIGGVHEGKIKILYIDNKNKKLKTECSIDIKKNKDAKVLEAIYINKYPYKMFNFEEIKNISIPEEEIEAIICTTDKDFLGIIYLKKIPTKNNKIKTELELLWKLNLKKGPIQSNNNNENIIKCICDLEKGFCFATEENKFGYLYIYNEVLSIDKDKVIKKYENKIKIGNPIKCMCKTECNYILITVDNSSVIKFWNLRYLTCINLFQAKGNTEEIPNIIKIIIVKNNNINEYYDLIMVTANYKILIYTSNSKKIQKIQESDLNSDEEEFAIE